MPRELRNCWGKRGLERRLAVLDLNAGDGSALFRDGQTVDVSSGVDVVLGEEAAERDVDSFDLGGEVAARCAVGVLHGRSSSSTQNTDVLA